MEIFSLLSIVLFVLWIYLVIHGGRWVVYGSIIGALVPITLMQLYNKSFFDFFSSLGMVTEGLNSVGIVIPVVVFAGLVGGAICFLLTKNRVGNG